MGVGDGLADAAPLAVASALKASAVLLQARADVWRASAAATTPPDEESPASADWRWVQQEVELADLLQAARGLVFSASTAADYQRLAAVLIHTIELRDVLLAVRLGRPVPAMDGAGALHARGGSVVWPQHDPRARLVPALQLRLKAQFSGHSPALRHALPTRIGWC